MIVENVPDSASLGVIGNTDFRDYPFFGQNFTRKVTQVMPERPTYPFHVDFELYLKNFRDSEFLFISSDDKAHGFRFIADEFFLMSKLMSKGDTQSIWIRKNLHPLDQCDDGQWPFSVFVISSSEVICPQFPIIIGNSSLSTPQGHFAPSINAEANEGLEFNLLVLRELEASFFVTVDPGDVESQQTMHVLISNVYSIPQTYTLSFEGEEVLEFIAHLDPQTYTIKFVLLDNSVETSISKIEIKTP
jgi:hypothetical protein